MILDRQNQYSDAQALTVTAASTDIIDHGIDRNMGLGTPMSVILSLDVAAKSSDGNETYSVALQVASDSAFSSPVQVGGAVTITRGDAIGTKYVLPIPADLTFDQYSRLYFTLGGTNPTVSVTAFLVPTSEVERFVAYAKNQTVS